MVGRTPQPTNPTNPENALVFSLIANRYPLILNQFYKMDQPIKGADVLTRTEVNGHDEAIDALRGLIASGDYQPGDRLPPERELIVSLGMGRSTLRRALETLEREGAIWRHVGKGTFVASNANGTAASALASLIGQVSPVNMMRARLSLEPAIAREAAINATGETAAAIGRARDRALAAVSWAEYEEHDDLFHRTIAEATGNVLLLSLFDHLNQVRRGVAWRSVVRGTTRPPRDHTSFAEHDRLVAAIETRDPIGAHAAMRDHLGSVSDRLFGET